MLKNELKQIVRNLNRLRTCGKLDSVELGQQKKGPDSIRAGISIIQDYKIIIHPRCVNFITEISNYTWEKDKFDNMINRPIDDFNHLMDAMRYAMEEFDGRKGVRLLM